MGHGWVYWYLWKSRDSKLRSPVFAAEATDPRNHNSKHKMSSTMSFSISKCRAGRNDIFHVTIIHSSLPLAIALAFLLTLPTSSLGSTYLHNESTSDLQALLCLKLHMSSPAGLLASWKNDSSQFCSWFGVSCSKRHPSRVIALNLESLELYGQIPPCIANLTFLSRIHLPNNQLSGQLPAEIGQLNRLQYLNLSFNNLSGMIPNTLSSCFRLQIVDLDSNSLGGSIPEGLGTLSSLSGLSFVGNTLRGSIPITLGSSSSLVSVDLTNNSLTGPIPPLLANSSSLQELYLTNNQLSGEIPVALFNSTSLQILALGLNRFVGSIPTFTNTDSPLQYLILQNHTIHFRKFFFPVILFLGDNKFHGSIPLSIGEIPNLQQLDMSYNILSGTVPASIFNISALVYLGMGMNNLTGEIPYSIGHTLPNIQISIMQENQFRGQIPTSLANTTNLQVVNLRYNAFHGIIPHFGSLPNLIELNLGMNQLEAGDWQLVRLYLDGNNIQGILPRSIVGLSKSLELLFLAANKISGTIPQEIVRFTNLKLLRMEQNLLTGNLPSSLGNLQNIISQRIPEQTFRRNSTINQSSAFQLRRRVDLRPGKPEVGGRGVAVRSPLESPRGGRREGHGKIFTLSSLSNALDLSHNQLSGKIPLEISGLINLGTLIISNNELSGHIPSTLGECVHLESLHMEKNLLEGTIPESFANLRGITVMDISQNNLSGEIPEFFENFTGIKLLNLSFNNLEGQVPTGGIFQNASEVFFQGNKKLCVSSPLLQLPLCNSKASRERKSLNILKVLGPISLSLVLLSCFTIVLLIKKRKNVKEATHPPCKELKKFSYADLVKATNGFSLANLVGSGKYGSVYKCRFEHEEYIVAVKVFKLDQLGAPRSFLTECEALRNTRHHNLVRVITACSTFDASGLQFKALILEYMPNGSLESWLYPKLEHGLRSPLSLGSRITIAIDIASALDYLHNHCVPPMVHCDLKPSNILLDDDMGARLADFGLAKFIHGTSNSCHNSSTSLLGPRGSIGYIAPGKYFSLKEYGLGSKLSREGDVYSYGIVILEMMTGRRPTDEMFTDGLNIHKFVEKAFSQNTSELLDACIASSFEDGEAGNNLDLKNHELSGVKGCIMHLVKLGLSCSVETPKDRPTMQNVYAEVLTIKEAFAELCG
ncbi:hypothetical protein U9M48_027043 [Paspalum notatum var. saurae]|uniref:Receptor kinase-like protein Xa21 n=1 Tax=Paspalum notatum var. saurae TaxID=547442 RepID=A0AAQ3TS41_PASNO